MRVLVVLGLRSTPQFPEHVHTSIATGSPGSLSFLQCSTLDAQTLTAAAGTTYFIQLSSAGDDPGGVITFGVERVRPVSDHRAGAGRHLRARQGDAHRHRLRLRRVHLRP